MLSSSGPSRVVTSGLFVRNQSTVSSNHLFFAAGVIFLGKGKPERLEKASRSGSSRFPGEGSFFLNQSITSSTAFLFSSGDKTP